MSTEIGVDKEHKLHTNCTQSISILLSVSEDLVANHFFYILIFTYDVSALTYTANPSSRNCHFVCVKCSGVLHALSVQSQPLMLYTRWYVGDEKLCDGFAGWWPFPGVALYSFFVLYHTTSSKGSVTFHLDREMGVHMLSITCWHIINYNNYFQLMWPCHGKLLMSHP